MEFQWPGAFFLLALIPLAAVLFFWIQRRRRRFAVRYSSLSVVRQAIPARSRLRRYLPPALFLLAFASLVTGLARPQTVTVVPDGRATVILAMDVSGSMRQNDIQPSRIAAAQRAALSFIDRQRTNNQIGIVAFAGFSQLVQPPTVNDEDLERAILTLTLARGTAIGSGIITALDTIAEYTNSIPATSGEVTAPVPEGQYAPAIIVLLTDGVYTTGPDPLEAAQLAVDRGVRVYTIGFGTVQGSPDWGSGFNSPRRRGIDEESLKRIAAMTGGEYYSASSASELTEVFDRLPTYLVTHEETSEISVIFAAIGALLVTGAVLLAQRWHPLP